MAVQAASIAELDRVRTGTGGAAGGGREGQRCVVVVGMCVERAHSKRQTRPGLAFLISSVASCIPERGVYSSYAYP